MRRGACCDFKVQIMHFFSLTVVFYLTSSGCLYRLVCGWLLGEGAPLCLCRCWRERSCWVALKCLLCVCSQSGSDFSILCVNSSGNFGGRAEAPDRREIKFKPSVKWVTCRPADLLVIRFWSRCSGACARRLWNSAPMRPCLSSVI